jgi:hypothetical protein
LVVPALVAPALVAPALTRERHGKRCWVSAVG